MIGRPHICPEIETCLAGRVITISLGPTRDDIVRFLPSKPSKDETPDAMDSDLEAGMFLADSWKYFGNVGSGHCAQNPIAHYWLIYIFRSLLASSNIEAILQELTISYNGDVKDSGT